MHTTAATYIKSTHMSTVQLTALNCELNGSGNQADVLERQLMIKWVRNVIQHLAREALGCEYVNE